MSDIMRGRGREISCDVGRPRTAIIVFVEICKFD